MASENREDLLSLWKAAGELSECDGRSLTKHWEELMRAFRTGEFAADGLLLNVPGQSMRRIHRRELGELITRKGLDKDDIYNFDGPDLSEFLHWTKADYLTLPESKRRLFAPSERSGFAVERKVFEQHVASLPAPATSAPDDCTTRLAEASNSRCPNPRMAIQNHHESERGRGHAFRGKGVEARPG